MTFGVLFLLGKLLLFRGMGQGYNQTDPAALLRHNSPLYLIYAALYLTVSTLLAVQLLPLALPILRFRRMKAEQQRFILFICAFILFVICGIAYAISIREDLGKLIPRVHLRYFAPAVFLLLPVFAVCPECSDTASRKKELTLLLALAILVIGLFRSANPSVVEQMTLQWVSGLNLRLSDAYGTESVLFWTIQTAEIVLALGAVVGIYAFFSAREKGVVRPFLLFLLIPVLVSGFLGHSSIGVTYTEHLAPYDSVGRLSDFFEQTEDNVLYLSDTYWQFHHAKAWNCRYEPVERSYYLIFSEYNDRSGSTETVESGTDDPAAGTRVGDIAFCGVIDEGHYAYTDRIDYIVIPRDAALAPENDDYYELVPALSDDYHTVYRNRDPETLVLDNIKADTEAEG